MSIYPRIPEVLLKEELDIPTPSIIYDFDSIVSTINKIKQDIKIIPNSEICFSVKANRNIELLKILSREGVGADVASRFELKKALNANMPNIFATSPGFTNTDIDDLYENNIIPDFNNISQISNYFSVKKREFIGVRVNCSVPLDDFESQTTYTKNSRFGIRLDSEELMKLKEKYRFKIKQIHLHIGEMRNSTVIKKVTNYIINHLHLYKDVEVINIGGGLTYLYSNEKEVKKTWTIVSEFAKECNEILNKKIRIIIEPGMLLMAMSGYLYTKVCSSDFSPNTGIKNITLDSSAWNLTYWTPQILIHNYTLNESKEEHMLFGNTCYEHDLFIESCYTNTLDIGDKILLSPAGAYVSSMARSLHGYPIPQEWLLQNNQLKRI